MPRRLFTDEQEAEIVRAYWTREPDGTWPGAYTIAERFGTNHRTIYSVMRRQGAPIRTGKQAFANGKQCKPITRYPPEGEQPLCRCGCGQPVTWIRNSLKWRKYVPGHRFPPGPHDSREWLYNAYWVRGLSAHAIAEECGTATHIVLRRLKAFDIPMKDASESKRGIFAGKKNPAWKGGVTPERQKLYKSLTWRQLVASIFERDGYRCQRCGVGQPSKHHLHAHHIKPWATNKALRTDPANLITLCRSCHLWVHSNANTGQEFL